MYCHPDLSDSGGYWVYVLRSDTTGRRYTGSSEDPGRRLVEHNSGQSPATRHGVPWTIVYRERFSTRAEAVRRELYFKTGTGRDELTRLIVRPAAWERGRRGDRS